MPDSQHYDDYNLPANTLPFAIHNGQLLSRGQLWADVQALAAQLPERPYVFNLCQNRYLFCVCLLATATRRQVCLLPPSGQIAIIEEIMRDYPGAYLAAENPQASQIDHFEITRPNSADTAQPPAFDWDSPAVMAFTSGSTGRPKPCEHSLKTFALSAGMAISALGLSRQRYLMVSTTPPQHMYGLETSVFWPLFSELMLCDARPFYPEDIRQTIAAAPYPAILTTTPTHLRSLIQAEAHWNNLAGVISATDTLSGQLAGETAAILGQSPIEIYGSTETLSFACRRTLQDPHWRAYPGARLHRKNQQTWLSSPHLAEPLAIQDSVEIEADGRFTVLGRQSDMIKIGGKRTSLAELNRRLTDIEGVADGFCFLQQQGPNAGRIGAVVISRLDKQAIRSDLQSYVDEVFLPRKIHFVDAIPRNAAGKLTRAAQEKLLADLAESV